MKNRAFLLILLVLVAFGCSGKSKSKTDTSDPENNPVVELKQANELIAAKRCAEAAKLYQAFLVKYPKDSGGWNLLGLAFLCDAKPDQAIPAMQKALEISPAFTDVHNNLGVAYMELKQYPEARAEFLKALADTQYPAAAPYFNLAKLAFVQQSYEESRALAKKVVQMSPDQEGPRVLYALSLERLGRYDEALISLKETARIAPDNLEVNFYLGSVLLRQGNHCEARTQLNKVLDADPLGELGQQAIALLKQTQCKQ